MNNVVQLKRWAAKRERALREEKRRVGLDVVGTPVWYRAPSTMVAIAVVLGGVTLGIVAVVYAAAHLIAMVMP